MTSVVEPPQHERCGGQFVIPGNDSAALPESVVQASWQLFGGGWSPTDIIGVDRRATNKYVRRRLCGVAGSSSKTRPAPGRLVPRDRRHEAPYPDAPTAIPLHDANGRLCLLALDFDDHGKPGADPICDVADLIIRLDQIRCPHVVAESSHDGMGRHVWIFLTEPLEGSRRNRLVNALSRRYLSLDTAPLRNTSTGRVRYPGSPHRRGGHSRITQISAPNNVGADSVLNGESRAPHDVDVRLIHTLTTETDNCVHGTWRCTDPQQIHAAIVDAAAAISHNASRPLPPTDDPHLPSAPECIDTAALTIRPRRPAGLPATAPAMHPELLAVTTAPVRPNAPTRPPAPTASWPPAVMRRVEELGLTAQVESLHPSIRAELNPSRPALRHDIDASGALFDAMIGCATAGWTSSDIRTFSDHFTPTAFTHAYSRRAHTSRIPRDAHSSDAILRRQFARAQHYSATLRHDDTSTLQATRSEILRLAFAALSWAEHHRITHHRTTHALCRTLEAHLHRMLVCGQTVYHAGSRDLALDAGFASPQTANTHTRTLIKLGVLQLVHPASGTRAHSYQLAPHLLTEPTTPTHHWTQGEPAPRLHTLAATIDTRLSIYRHDIWASPTLAPGLPVTAAQATAVGTDLQALTTVTGYDEKTTKLHLQQLRDLGLVTRNGATRLNSHTFRQAAAKTGTAGTLHRRRTHFHAEKLAWAWWTAEVEYLRAQWSASSRHLMTGVLGVRGRYPRIRSSDGNAHPDHERAMQQIFTELSPRTWKAE